MCRIPSVDGLGVAHKGGRMSMGEREDRPPPLWIAAPERSQSAGHRFYETLNELLREADFDRRVEASASGSTRPKGR